MSDTVISVIIVVVLFGGIWWNYRLFMRGNWPEQKTKAMLPQNFSPDFFHVKADTYVGYEKKTNKIAVVEGQHARMIEPKDVVSVEPEEESIWGIRHQWLVVSVRDRAFPRYRIWFRFDRGARDEWRQRLKEICGAHNL
ncbi:MAG TPA: hypothetical protein VHE58_05385 [Burkholderiales bacterium]|nr:hypothetical protein [Burkholderiales bacterium]